MRLSQVTALVGALLAAGCSNATARPAAGNDGGTPVRLEADVPGFGEVGLATLDFPRP